VWFEISKRYYERFCVLPLNNGFCHIGKNKNGKHRFDSKVKIMHRRGLYSIYLDGIVPNNVSISMNIYESG
jgi:hypothetical protein